MAYRLQAGEHVDDGIRRLVREQIRRGMEELSTGGAEPARAVHQVRKRFKKIRGVLRLVRCALGDDYDRENDHYRELGRRLSSARDADAMLEAVASLERVAGDRWDPAFEAVREGLQARRMALAAAGGDLKAKVAEVLVELADAERRIDGWSLRGRGFGLLVEGLRHGYSRSRKERKRAGVDQSVDAWHRWRKRVKDHWYHVRVLADLRPEMMNDRDLALRALSELLGDDHDLSVLHAWTADDPAAYGGEKIVGRFMPLIDARRDRLRFQALDLGGRVFEEKPRVLVERLRRWWDQWHEPPVA